MFKYYCSNYSDIITSIMEKKNWIQIHSQENDIKFSYSKDIEGELMLASDIELNFLNNITISQTEYDNYVKIYVLIINSTSIYIYKEGKIYNSNKPDFLTKTKHYHTIFSNINTKIYEIIKPHIDSNPLSEKTFRIITLTFGINNKLVELISIEKNPDLSRNKDKIDKMKLHYWIINDLIDLFVFRKNKGHRWYQCNNIKKLTYLINRSSILKNILNKDGWVEEDVDKEVNFSYWDTYDAKGVKVQSKISTIPRYITNKMDNKKSMYLTLKNNNLTYFLPITYTDLRSINSNIFIDNKLFFLKKITGSGGKDVYPINTFTMFKNIIKDNYENYILQEEVNNIYLENNHKTTLRLYVLLTEKLEIYIHKEGKVNIYPNIYDKTNLDNKIHNAVYSSIKKKYSTMYYYKETFNKIKNITFLSINPFIKNIELINCYQILGLDYILDNNLTPYLIEINTYPDLSASNNVVKEINTSIINDFYEFYIKKTNKHNWILCNLSIM